MTIHKSKGLEFDYVFIPFLEKTAGQDMPELLRWQTVLLDNTPQFTNKQSTKQASLGLLMSPMPERQTEKNPLYRYLGELQAEKALHELKRLLYVAITRGRQAVYLSFAVTSGNSEVEQVEETKETEETIINESKRKDNQSRKKKKNEQNDEREIKNNKKKRK